VQCRRLAEQEHLSADREKDRAVLLESREEEDEEVQVLRRAPAFLASPRG